MRYLPLTFPQNGLRVALGCARGQHMRYEIAHEDRGVWCLTIEADGLRRSRNFTTERSAQKFARDDFRRRQLVRQIAA